MKQLIQTIGIVVLATTLTSCMDKEKYKEIDPQQCWGTVSGTQERFSIVSDNGETLRVTENYDNAFRIKDGMRVIANYEVLDAKDDAIRVNGMRQLLTKTPVYSSQLLLGQIDSLGKDPIEPIQAWFGIGRYLNITFIISINDVMSQKHMISLLIDSSRSTADKACVVLKHNANGDQPLKQGLGHVSFDLDQLMQNRTSLDIVLEWAKPDNTTGTLSGTIRRDTTSKSGLSFTEEPAFKAMPSARIN